MAIERGVPDWQSLRPTIERLQWGRGLSREEMLNQSEELRQHPNVTLMLLLPETYRFPNADSVFSYFEQVEKEGRLELEHHPPPVGYPTQSPTGETVAEHRYPPSVGSGAGSGSTGASAQTGVGGERAEEEEPLI